MIELWILTILVVNTGRSWESPHQYPSQSMCMKVGAMTVEQAKIRYPTQPLEFSCKPKGRDI